MLDESYNNAAKENQMDLHIHYWDFQKNVVTRIYGSDVFGKSSAKDILHGFETCLGALLKEKMIQISSDGSSVNLSFLDMIKDNCLTEELPNLIELSSCRLHTAHNAFKHMVNIPLDSCLKNS